MTDEPAEERQTPKTWGIVSGTLWALFAFLSPQFFLLPFVSIIRDLKIDRNAKVFLIQGVSELASIIILWFILKYRYHTNLRSLGLGKFSLGGASWALLAFPAYLLMSILASSLVGALFSVDLTQEQNVGYNVGPLGGPELFLVFVGLVLLAPFVEELVFRGFLFSAFRRKFGFWFGSLLVSLLFAVAHGQLNVGIDVFVLSMFLCYLRERTGSLWPAIALHMLKNLVAFLVLFIIGVS